MGRNGRVAAWIAANLACSALIALPDADDRLFSISDLHGPSLVDAIGAGVLVLLWVPVLAATVRAVRGKGARVRFGIVIAAAGLLLALVITIVADLGWWWLPPALGLGALQLAILWPSRHSAEA